MTMGRKTGGRDFKKGKPGGPGRPKLPKEIKDLRKLTASEFIKKVNKYLFMSKEELKAGINNEGIEVLDLFIRNSLIKGIEKGDYGTLEKILDRIIGKVKMEMKLSGDIDSNVNSKSEITISDKTLKSLGDAIARATAENS